MRRFISRHWDLVVSLAVGLEVLQVVPRNLGEVFVHDMYSGGIAILAVVFSVVFAAITLFASIGDDAFLSFLEEDGALGTILRSFNFTLNILFGSLVLSILEFGLTSYEIGKGSLDQPSWRFAVYCFALSYSLLSSRLVGNDVIRFARLRAKFIRSRNPRG